MQTKTKLRDRVISALLVLVMAVGMIPLGIVEASAAEPYKNVSEAIADHGQIELTINLADNEDVSDTILTAKGNRELARWLGHYSGHGLSGFGYCCDLSKYARSGMTVIASEAYREKDPLVINTYYSGYTDESRDKEYFLQFIVPYANDLGYTQSRYYGDTDMSQITQVEWEKATQMAVWMSLKVASGVPMLSLDNQMAYQGGQLVSDYNPNAFDTVIYANNNNSPSKRRVIQAAIMLHLRATYLQATGMNISDRTVGSTDRPVEYNDFKDAGFYPTSAVVDFTSANADGTGNIADAYDSMTTDQELGIHKQTIDGTEYYVIYWMFNSKTQASGWNDISLSGNIPAGTVIKPLNQDLDKEFAETYGLYNQTNPTSTGEPYYLWYFDDRGYREVDGQQEFSTVPTTSDNGGLINDIDNNAAQPNRESWVTFFKVCIPVNSVSASDGSSANIQIDMKNDAVLKYNCYRCPNTGPRQPFLIGDTNDSVSSVGVIKWGNSEPTPGNGSYFTIYKKDDTGKVLSGAEFTAKLQNGSYTMTATTNSSGVATFTIPAEHVKDDAGQYTVWEVTETKAPDGYELTNQVITVTAKEGNSGSYTVVNESSPPPTPTESILQKVDAESKIGLFGAEFEFTSTTSGSTGRFITDSFGNIQVQWWAPTEANYLEPGTYLVREVVPPEGYNLDSDGAQQITLTYDIVSGEASHSGQLIFNNSKKPSIIIKKTDENSKGLDGACFDVYKDGALIDNIGPTEGGVIEYFGPDGEGLENGYYEFKETTAPEGYMLSTEVKGVHVDINNLNTNEVAGTVAFLNFKTPTIAIEKFDATDGVTGLAGAVFRVTIDGEDLGTYTTDDAGRIAISEETYGKYLDDSKDSWTITVEEIEAPPGYLLPADPVQTLELHRGETLKTFTFVDDKYPEIKIQKVDAETGEPLAGAGFRIMIDGEVFRDNVLTDDNGEIVISYDEFKDFLDDDNKDSWTIYVEEVTPPDGYLLPVDRVQEQELHQGESLEPFTFRDTKYPYIEIQKHDAETGEPLAGAQFTVEIDGHQLAGPFVSDEDGIIRIDYEQYKHFLGEETDPDKTWTITVTEVTAPEDYNRDPVDTNGWTMTASLTMGEQLPPFIFDDTSYRDIKVTGISA